MLTVSEFRYCPKCATEMISRIPSGDNRLRNECPACGFVHYINPIPVVGTVAVCGGKVLLCRRAIEPRRGYWTLPAGFMEAYETLAEGAFRETIEETGEAVRVDSLLCIVDVPPANQIHFFFLASFDALSATPGPETLEQKLFTPEEIPWEDISFETVKIALECYLQDLQSGQHQVHRVCLRD